MDKAIELIKEAQARLTALLEDMERGSALIRQGESMIRDGQAMILKHLRGHTEAPVGPLEISSLTGKERELFDAFLARHKIEEKQKENLSKLSDREKQVFDLIRQGLDKADIGTRLDVSAKTVARHLDNIREKLAVENIYELKRFAKDTLIDTKK